MDDTLKDIVRGMSTKERQQLMDYLRNSLDAERAEAERARSRRSGEYCKAMERMSGVPLTSKGRTAKEVNARVVVASVLSHHGESEPSIGRMLHRDHATIHHYLARMRFAINHPEADHALVSTYNEYLKAISHDIQ